MKRTIFYLLTFFLCLPIFCVNTLASEDDTVRVGLYYNGSSSNGALTSANLENYSNTGSGYYFGYYDQNRTFVKLGETDETQISMSQDLNLYISGDGSYTTSVIDGAAVVGCYHLQLEESFGSFDAARAAAEAQKAEYGIAFPAYDHGAFVVRVGAFSSKTAAQTVLTESDLSAFINSGSSYTVVVTKTGTNEILFEYDDGGNTYLAVSPRPVGNEAPQTWCKGYRYNGGFEYDRSKELSSGKINVINVVGLEDYVKGVITYEMSASWPAEALKAQSVCARTFALNQHKHDARNFDVCSTTNCQVYRGTAAAKPASDAAVDATAGLEMYYKGKVIDASYYSSNGGASEDSENVWYSAMPYLRGKQDPYEGLIKIPSYAYEKTYTAKELSSRLRNKGYSIGPVASIRSEYTKNGNMYAMTFTDTSGASATVKKENCKFLLSMPSMRFTVSGSGNTVSPVIQPEQQKAESVVELFVNTIGSKLQSIRDAYTVSGNGTVSKMNVNGVYAVTSDGKILISQEETDTEPDSPITPDIDVDSDVTIATGDTFTFSGTGNGHNVGMSQYGAYAMAKQGMTFENILNFYYTDITIE